jgi:hypothetical protein
MRQQIRNANDGTDDHDGFKNPVMAIGNPDQQVVHMGK